MFGCLRRLGCLVVLAIVAVVAWFTRDHWWPLIRDRGKAPTPAVATSTWEPVSDAGASRARQAIESLGRKSGPVFANVKAADLASYVFIALSRQLPPSAEEIEATVIGDRVYVRASVKLSDFGKGALGPLAGILGDREVVQFGGTFDVVRPGLAEFVVRDLKIKELSVPASAIPKLLRQIDRGRRPEGVADDALPLEIPPYIGDIRIARGRITIYKTVS